jgi:SAM-dependent MidA family methyltransferase
MLNSATNASNGSAAVERALRRRILRRGPIPFAEFMEIALYHPRGGYYMTSARVGRSGDFTTSPEIHPAFGALVGRFVAHVWRAMGTPHHFTIVEIGGGTGKLAKDLLDTARRGDPLFYESLKYVMGEVSPAMRRRQRALLNEAHGGKVIWRQLETHPGWPVVGCVISNEVVDALPFHRVVMQSARLLEMCVGLNGNGFVQVLRTPGRAVSRYLETVGAAFAEGQVVEARPAAGDWIRAVASKIARGCVLTVDHGYESNELYGERFPRGTLVCYSRATMSDDPLQRPGLQDISARVDFTALKRHGAAAGLAALPLITQREFLRQLGMGQLLGEIRSARIPAEERAKERRALQALLDPEGLGNCKVLVQHKGLSQEEVSILADVERARGSLALDLTRDAPPKRSWQEWQGTEV